MGAATIDEQSGDGGSATRRSGEIRDRILAAAVTLFSEESYTATTMDRIATEAKVARATVFNHFASKELLLGAVLREHHLSFADLLRTDTDPALPLRTRIIEAQARWSLAYAHDPDVAIPLVRAWVHAGGPLLPTADLTTDVLIDVVSRAQDDGSLPSTGSARAIGRALNDSWTGAIIRWTKEDVPTAESLRDAMLAAVRAIRFD